MTLGGNRLAIKYLNPDLCFAAWIIAGSASRARDRLFKAGIMHPITGEAPSKMGIAYAAKESKLYREYLKRRTVGSHLSSTPTKEEYNEALKLFDELIGEQVAYTKRLHEQYGRTEEFAAVQP